MIRKLYYENAYLKEFVANVIEVEKRENQFHVVLDQTAFYPEGGGQPSDTGTIHDLQVTYVYEKEQKIYHVLNDVPSKLTKIKCKIDWERRFDHMQQHLGQHILSACFEELFDAETVGFHLGEEITTIDVTIENISSLQEEKVEYFANQIVFNNLHVMEHFPDSDQLKKMSLRKPPKVDENIRIIEIDQFDLSPCGGTHPSFTGEVGLIKIRKCEKTRGNTRIEFVCGNRSLKDFAWKNHYINKVSSLLSLKDIHVLEGMEKLYSDYNTQKKELIKLKEQLLDYECTSLHNEAPSFKGIKIIKKAYDDKEFKDLRMMAQKIVSQPHTIVLFGLKNEKAQMILTRSSDIKIDMNQLFKEIASMINGKGGGNAQTAQGGGDDLRNLESALEAAYIKITNQYL